MSSPVLTVHVLTDDKARKRGFLAEHGLSLFIEYNCRAVLFDTGQSDVYLKNAARLKKDPAASDAVIISHGHYDHCGGLEFFPYHADPPKIYISEKAFESKFARNNDGTFRDVGIPKAVRSNTSFGENAVLCDEHTEIFPGEKIRALFAGMHLESADDEELEDIMDFFSETGIGQLFPLHCTGIRTISAMKGRFKDQCMVLYSGDSVTI